MPTVLVVDDLAADRLVAGGLLEKDSKLSVVYAAGGKQALEEIERHVPDIVVTDLQMPDMNGLELVESVKEGYPLIPTILMTAKGSEEIAIRAIERGAASYVPKKLLAQELLETVQRVLAASTEERGYARLMTRLEETRFVLDNDLGLISSLVNYLRQTVRSRHLFSENECLRIGTALDEALLNAFYHGNLEVSSKLKEVDYAKFHRLAEQRLTEEPYCERHITVTAEFSDTHAVFVIADDGPGFNPKDVPDPTDPQYLQKPSGRGLLLMRTFMDEIRFNDNGNQVTLVKKKTNGMG